MELYNETCFECSKLITNKYSTSFSQGINAFDRRFRYPVYAIYGFVRFADEIVDTFHSYPQSKLIDDFEADAFRAIDQKISLNPVLHAFQSVVNQYGIERELIQAFLASMKMDLEQKVYDSDSYKAYICGSAEVIGLMCLRVFCEGDDNLYRQLSPAARSLGSALQKINFLRDLRADHDERGRIYFPGVDFSNFNEEEKQRIEADVRNDLENGLAGIKKLPAGAAGGVYIAYVYYQQLFKKMCKTPADVITRKRIRIADTHKAFLYYKAMIRYKMGWLK